MLRVPGSVLVVVLAVVLGLVLGGALTACSAQEKDAGTSPEPPASSPPPAAAPAPLTTVWRSPMTVLSQPVVSGEVAVVYAVVKGRLHIRGLATSTGDVLWSHRASTGGVSSGRTLQAQVSGNGAVVWFVKAPGLDDEPDPWVVVRVADVRTGKMRATGSQPLFASALPYACGRRDADTCVEATPGGMVGPMRVDLRTGNARSISRQRGIEVGDGWVVTSDTGLARYVHGTRKWTMRLGTAVGRGYGFWSGWSFRQASGSAIVAMSVGQTADRERRENDIVIGVDENTGRVRWKRSGASLFCASTAQDAVVLACATSGLVDTVGHVCRGLSSSVQRIDPRTGKPQWSVDLGRGLAVEPLSVGCEPEVVPHTDDTVLALFAGRATQISVSDGTSTVLPGDALVWAPAVRPVPVDDQEWSATRCTPRRRPGCRRPPCPPGCRRTPAPRSVG